MAPLGSVGRPRPRTPLTKWEASPTWNEPDGETALCCAVLVDLTQRTVRKVEQMVEGDGGRDLIKRRQSDGGLPVVRLCRSGYLIM